jgi:peroxiredoxin
MQGEKAVLFGVPDCGKVCSEQHLPSYLQQWDELRRLGVTKILCVAVGDPAAADSWASKMKVDDGSKIQV